jgi:hypothetical protein
LSLVSTPLNFRWTVPLSTQQAGARRAIHART